MDKDFFGMVKQLSKSKYSVPILIFVTFLYLIRMKIPFPTILRYLAVVFILCVLAIVTHLFLKIIDRKRGPVPNNGIQIPLDPTLIRFLKILEKKGIRILREIEKAVKNLQKKAFFILESGESSPPVSVDKYIFCWSDAIKGNISELKDFLQRGRWIKDLKFIDLVEDSGQETIVLRRKKKTLSLTKEGRSIVLRDIRGISGSFGLKRVNGKENVYEKIGTRTTFFTQFINQKFVLENRYRFPLIGTSSFLIFTKDISDEKIISDYRKFVENKYNEIHEELKDSNNRFLFVWNRVEKEERERFIRFLREDISIDWTHRARVMRSKNNRIIEVIKGDKFLRFMRKKNRVFLEICDGRSYEYILETESGKPKVYQDMKKTLEDWYKSFRKSSNLVLVTRPYGFSIDYAVKLFSDKMSKDELDRLTKKMLDVMQQKIVIQNIRFSYLFEAVGFGEKLVREFEKLEDELVEKLAEKFELDLTEKDYFCRLLSQENFLEAFMKSTRKMNPFFITRIKKMKRKYTNLENLISYLHKHLEAMV